MGRKLRSQLTYANVMSTLCFFLLISGGAAYAATQLGKNTVGTKQLKKNAVTTAKIKKEAVTAAKIKQGTLTGAQINASTLGTVPAAATATTALNVTSLDGTLASGKTLRGNFDVAGTNDPVGYVAENSVSFAIPLTTAPTFHSLTPGSGPTAECPGSADDPTAAPGHACFYETDKVSTGILEFRNPGRFGTGYFTPATTGGVYLARGRWAVTAP